AQDLTVGNDDHDVRLDLDQPIDRLRRTKRLRLKDGQTLLLGCELDGRCLQLPTATGLTVRLGHDQGNIDLTVCDKRIQRWDCEFWRPEKYRPNHKCSRSGLHN